MQEAFQPFLSAATGPVIIWFGSERTFKKQLNHYQAADDQNRPEGRPDGWATHLVVAATASWLVHMELQFKLRHKIEILRYTKASCPWPPSTTAVVPGVVIAPVFPFWFNRIYWLISNCSKSPLLRSCCYRNSSSTTLANIRPRCKFSIGMCRRRLRVLKATPRSIIFA